MSDEQQKKVDDLIRALPDAGSAQRFFAELSARHPSDVGKLLRSDGLLSDVLTISSFSPLLSTTLLQHPEYIWWLSRHRGDSKIRSKDELLESLARFSLTNSEAEPQVLLARFRRRELLRIFLLDIRRLATIAETTEEISNLADAILEHALGLARQEMDNRFGAPLAADANGRLTPAKFCIVSFGKLGSKELNYSSDIDLLFVYSDEGTTSGKGSRGAVTNREYFVKLSEHVIKLVGGQTGEGAAYRVDVRLRPHGRVGALALSLADTVGYYRNEAQDWERQVLIRSRASAGEEELYVRFFGQVEDNVYSKEQSVEKALLNVRTSKEKINREHGGAKGFNVKLGHGGIREIEFISQALQLAHGGHDRWLRVPHTLISLARLSDRKLISDSELTQLFDAYEFLREVEHVLQMENGLQTHIVPEEPEKRALIAKRMGFKRSVSFEEALAMHASNVSRVFARVFGPDAVSEPIEAIEEEKAEHHAAGAEDRKGGSPLVRQAIASLGKSDGARDVSAAERKILEDLAELAPSFAEMVCANPSLIEALPLAMSSPQVRDYRKTLEEAVDTAPDFQRRLAALRSTWSRMLIEIAVLDIEGIVDTREAKRRQTSLAEASVDAAIRVAAHELGRRLKTEVGTLPVAVLGLGKLGGRGVDYGSDLDIVIVYDESVPVPSRDMTHAEFYSRFVEIFTNTIASLTREGHLYRIDLRLRPDGKNGPNAVGRRTIVEYFETRAAIWEWLAYVKLRCAGGDRGLGKEVEDEIRSTIQRRAKTVSGEELAAETLRIRERLEAERSAGAGARDIDIKFGAGGLLDVYFATRCLQLLHSIAEDEADRSTGFTLKRLLEEGIIGEEDHAVLSAGYGFLSALDHSVRLAVGRSTRVPLSNHEALKAICKRMGIEGLEELKTRLIEHQRRVREVFARLTA